MDPILALKNVTFKYFSQKSPTLFDINLSIYPGEKILIVGASGSGKTTLGNCLNGLIPFSYAGDLSGEIMIQGNANHQTLFERSKVVGTVLQDSDAQFVGIRTAEDIAFALENENVSLASMRQQVQQIAQRFDIDRFLHQRPQALSGGQKQRTSMAGILIHPIDILLFDEPLANLDPAAGKQAIEIIDELHHEGKTIIIIEHRLEDVLHRNVDRIVLMHQGRIVADLPPAELLRSTLLREYGLREPLYVSAMRYANVPLEDIKNLASIHQLKVQNPSRLQDWIRTQTVNVSTPSSITQLSLDNVSFSYDNNYFACNQLNFRVQQGEMVALVGKNGAGKTTVAKLICGFEEKYQGVIKIQGIDVRKDSIQERAQRVGYVMQNPNHMITKQFVKEELELGLHLRGLSQDEINDRVDSALRICGITRFKEWPISALSFGEKKRVTIASILVLEPSILIVDEPTAGQDYKHYSEIMEFLKDLNVSHQYTILMITHDMHLMLEYATRAIVLADGICIADTTPSEILTSSSITAAASLKETSLFDLANHIHVDPLQLVQVFLEYERRQRFATV